MYIYIYIKHVGLCQSRLSTADFSIFCYNMSLITLTVVCLTAAKFKPLIFSMSGFALSNIANIFIVMIYACCLHNLVI
jgi:hypothetical protein